MGSDRPGLSSRLGGTLVAYNPPFAVALSTSFHINPKHEYCLWTAGIANLFAAFRDATTVDEPVEIKRLFV